MACRPKTSSTRRQSIPMILHYPCTVIRVYHQDGLITDCCYTQDQINSSQFTLFPVSILSPSPVESITARRLTYHHSVQRMRFWFYLQFCTNGLQAKSIIVPSSVYQEFVVLHTRRDETRYKENSSRLVL